jgi:hypothetical protein
MDQVSLLNQTWQSTISDDLKLPVFGRVDSTEKINSNLHGVNLENLIDGKTLAQAIDWGNKFFQSPTDFLDAFPEIIYKIYGQEVDTVKSVFKFLFDAIKFVAQKLGGWDKLIDLIMLVLPLPKHVKIILEVLKKILPVISPLPKETIPQFIFTALEKGKATETPEDLLQQIAEKFKCDSDNNFDGAGASENEALSRIIADGKMSLEDKVMYVLMSLSAKEEKEILKKSHQLDDASSDSRQRLLIELQIQVQKLMQTYSALSNLMKAFHETSMNSIRNFR